MTQDHVDAQGLTRFFAVLEELCRDGDKLVREFVQDEVCEILNDHSAWWRERVDPYIGPEMVIACEESRIFIDDLMTRHQRSLDEGLDH